MRCSNSFECTIRTRPAKTQCSFRPFRRIVTSHEFDSLGEDFEKKENQLFGQDGFERMVDKVASIEKRFGIYDLAQLSRQLRNNSPLSLTSRIGHAAWVRI